MLKDFLTILMIPLSSGQRYLLVCGFGQDHSHKSIRDKDIPSIPSKESLANVTKDGSTHVCIEVELLKIV